jgi:hypothetical protein
MPVEPLFPRLSRDCCGTIRPVPANVSSAASERGTADLPPDAGRAAVALAKLGLLHRMRRQYGLGWALRFVVRWLLVPRWWPRRRSSFVFEGRRYDCFVHRYRVTWANERAVEIPVALQLLAEHSPADVLEVGNVLSHYVATRHRVVDKYDQAPHVERLDVLDIPAGPRYRLVLSVSTLEHVGWDERPRDAGKALRAVEHLKGCLTPGGRLVFTVPLGYNPVVDELLAEGRMGLSQIACLERVGDLDWRQVSWEGRTRTRYGAPLPFANTVAVCTYEAPA